MIRFDSDGKAWVWFVATARSNRVVEMQLDTYLVALKTCTCKEELQLFVSTKGRIREITATEKMEANMTDGAKKIVQGKSYVAGMMKR